METGTDERLKRELDVGRRTRAAEDRKVTEQRELSDDDRLEMFRAQLFNDALPDLPPIEGYHMCWLTTTNPRDPIHRRMQLGYEPVRPEEVPGMVHATIKTGEWSGMVGVNEMLAFKLPMSLYQRYMREAHHDAPLREEAALSETADRIRGQAEGDKVTISEGEGLQDLRRTVSAPALFD